MLCNTVHLVTLSLAPIEIYDGSIQGSLPLTLSLSLSLSLPFPLSSLSLPLSLPPLSLSPVRFVDQFLSIGTSLPDNYNIYGIGEHVLDHFKLRSADTSM